MQKCLFLDNTQVTDAGLTHLKDPISLRVCYVRRTRVTDAGVKELKRVCRDLVYTVELSLIEPAGRLRRGQRPRLHPILRHALNGSGVLEQAV